MATANHEITPADDEWIPYIGTRDELWRRAQWHVAQLTESGPRPVLEFLKAIAGDDLELAAKIYWKLDDWKCVPPWVFHAVGASELMPTILVEMNQYVRLEVSQ